MARARPIRLESRILRNYAANFASVEAAIAHLLRHKLCQRRLLDGELFWITHRGGQLLASVRLIHPKGADHTNPVIASVINTIIIKRWASWNVNLHR